MRSARSGLRGIRRLPVVRPLLLRISILRGLLLLLRRLRLRLRLRQLRLLLLLLLLLQRLLLLQDRAISMRRGIRTRNERRERAMAWREGRP